MSLRPAFRIKVKATGVEISHHVKKDSSEASLFKDKVYYYLRNWERMGRQDPRTLQPQMATDGPEVAALEREKPGDVIGLYTQTPDGGTRNDVFSLRTFRAHPEVLDGIEIKLSDGHEFAKLGLPLGKVGIGVLLQIAAEHPSLLPALHGKLLKTRHRWRLTRLSDQERQGLDAAVSEVEALMART
jgi:hypothetical protein